MRKLLSILIPTYNMEGYLRKCLDSLIIPSLSLLDIIVINDGSKDRSLDIAKEYCLKYPDAIRVINKPNGNYGSCINIGLKYSEGKYIKILDADDSFTTKSLERYVSLLDIIEDDLIISDYFIVNDTGTVVSKQSFSKLQEKVSYNIKRNQELLTDAAFEMHAIAYKKSIFNTIEYKQSEGISYTDQEWMFFPMSAVNSFTYIKEPLYQYLVGREGQTINWASRLRSVKHSVAVGKSLIQMYSLIPERRREDLKTYYNNRLNRLIPYIYKTILLRIPEKQYYEDLSDIDRQIYRILPKYYLTLNKDCIPYIHFHYIYYWRSRYFSGKNLPLLSLFNFIVRALMRLKAI